jgi:hypothetical protein
VSAQEAARLSHRTACRVPPTPPSGRCSLSWADLAGRRGRVTVNHAPVGAVTCLSPAVVLRALDRLPALGLLAREGPTVALTTPAGTGRT